jgi:hypothetical protein
VDESLESGDVMVDESNFLGLGSNFQCFGGLLGLLVELIRMHIIHYEQNLRQPQLSLAEDMR